MHTDRTPGTTTRTVTVPALPARVPGLGGDNAVKVYDTLLAVLGIVGATVSGWSIATLLHDDGGMQWGFAVLGVGVYDLLAFMAGLMVYIRRHEPHRAVGAQLIMLASIAGSAYVNYMHGRQVGGDLVALVFGASPVVFEVAFAMRHNVLSAITAVLFPRAMWRRYKDGVWINLHTGRLPVPSASVPEGVTVELPQVTEVPAVVPAERKPLPVMRKMTAEGLPTVAPIVFRNRNSEPEVVAGFPEVDCRKVTEGDRKLMVDVGLIDPELPVVGPGCIDRDLVRASGPLRAIPVPVPLPEAEVPEASGGVPEGTEARSEAVAEALRKGDRMTGTTVGAMYGVSDSMGRTYIRRAKEINAARDARRDES